MMKTLASSLVLCFSLGGCTHMRPIETVSTPLELSRADMPSIDSIRVEINYLNPQKDKSKTDVVSLRSRIEDALQSQGLVSTADSPNVLVLDINRFMIVGDGLVFCQSVVEITARAKLANNILRPERFSASRNGYFCAFGDSTEKMKDSTKEALEEVLKKVMNWVKKS